MRSIAARSSARSSARVSGAGCARSAAPSPRSPSAPKRIGELVAGSALEEVGAELQRDPLETEALEQADRGRVPRVDLRDDALHAVVVEEGVDHAPARLGCVALPP